VHMQQGATDIEVSLKEQRQLGTTCQRKKG